MARELVGISVVVTRAREQAAALVRLLEARGAAVIVRPTIHVEIRRDVETRRRFAAIGEVDGVVITSSNAARALCELADERLRRLPIFAIGAATADELPGFTNVHISNVATARGLLAHVSETFHGVLEGRRFVSPQSSRAGDVLTRGLRDAKANVDIIDAYDTTLVVDGPPLPAGRIDWITFTSPSAVEGFVYSLTSMADTRIACLGETTRDAAIAAGLTVSVAPAHPSLVALVDGIARATGR